MGMCSQDDALWEELTAREQLQICCSIKGVKGSLVKAETEKRYATNLRVP
jgi:ABC-type multidrug transport system ATPase subunit